MRYVTAATNSTCHAGSGSGRKKKDMVIHCIGDSHANFFCGFDKMQPEWPSDEINNKYSFLNSYRIGPVLAFNLCRNNSSTRGRENLFDLLGQIPLNSNILFCFGEIDCRAHVILQSERQSKPTKEIVKDVVDRYFFVLKEVQSAGYNVLVWNVIPSAPTDINNRINVPPKYLFHGSCSQRNEVTRQFNQYLKELVTKEGMFFLDFFDALMNEDGTVKLEYYCTDDIHLSQKAMPIVLDELERFPGFDVSL